MQPMANLHYVLAPAGVVRKTDLSPRWGLLSYGEMGVSVVVKPLAGIGAIGIRGIGDRADIDG